MPSALATSETKSTKSRRQTRSHHARPKFKSVIRVRPLSKKENEDHVVLEALADGSAVALHPSVKDLMSPHSVSTVQTGQDTEFPCDVALPSEASQDKVYFKVGRPIALAAMESLKREKRKKTTHLILSMGLAQSGKSYTCMGNASNLSKRKSETDGLIPRMIDSLFFQSLHNSTCNQKNISFAVEVSILQVNQNKSNPADCKIVDLLQPVPSKSPRSSNPVGALGNIATTILGGGSSKSVMPTQKSRYAELNEPVKVKQDPKSSECIITNATVKQCTSAEETRLAVQKALTRSRQVSSKKYQCHSFVQVQPVLISKRSGRLVLEGEPIAVLDMAGWEKRSTKSRAREALSNRDDAHTAVMHCLKAMQHNKEIISSGVASSSKLRQIPFLQHQATMLLQPLFSPKHTNKTSITLLLTVSPGTKDYSEKKVLLGEINQLHRPSAHLSATTGVMKDKNRKRVQTDDSSGSDPADNFNAPEPPQKPEKKVDNVSTSFFGKDLEDSMTYSDASPEKALSSPISPTLPPPLAPGFIDGPSNASVMKQRPSAPFDDDVSADGATAVANLTISPKSTSTAGSSSKGGEEEEDVHDTGRTEEELGQKFSYINTLNKVVHASKKTGRKVLERMTVTTTEAAEYQSRIEQLETENQELMEKVKLLEEKNKELVEAGQKLRDKSRPSLTPSPAKSTGSSRFDAFLSSIQPAINSRTVSTDTDEDYKEAESASEETAPLTGHTMEQSWKPSCGSIFDNLLMQHMTTMTDGFGQPAPSQHYSSVPRVESKEESALGSSSVRKSDVKGDTFDDVHRAAAPYDNELFQHMAMINNL